MTADTGVMLWCDHIDREKPPGERTCPGQISDGTYGDRTPGLPDGTYFRTRAGARREARRLGWVTGVRSDGTRGGGFDFCPAHKPARKPAAGGAS